ncbi:hypothetical protein HK097_005308, partial [Rhizophlyctis rosea]
MDSSSSSYLVQAQIRKVTSSNGDAPSSLVNASVTLVDNKLYLFGGFHLYSDEVFNDLWVFNFADSRWKRVDHIKGQWPCARSGHTTSLWDKKLVIFGGIDKDDVFLNDLHILHLQTLTWEQPQMLGDIPLARERHSSIIHDNKLYIIGGYQKQTSQEEDTVNTINTLDILDLRTLIWSPPIPFVPRFSHFCGKYQNRLYVYGGLNHHMRVQDIAFIDLHDYTYSSIMVSSDTAPPPLGQHFAQIYGNRLVVVVTADLKQDKDDVATGVWSLELDSLRWRKHEDGSYLTPILWHYFAMEVDEKELYLFGADEKSDDESFLGVALAIDLEACGIVNVPGPDIGKGYGELLGREDLSDFSICSTSEPEAPPIRVHSLVLRARWPHFNNMFESGMSETTSRVLKLEDTHVTIKAFIQYLYTDTLTPTTTVEVITDLLIMSSRYCLDRLTKLCSEYLNNVMDVENVARIFRAASRSGEKGLKMRAFGVILSEFGSVVRTRGFR